MEIAYAGTQLVDGTVLLPGAGWQRSLQQLVGTVQGVGRAASTPTARGNRVRALGGSVTHIFDTHAEAVAFWAKHGDSLPNSGDLVVSVGGVAQATWAGAVLESVTAPPPVGVSLTITYTFRLASAAT